MNKESSRKLAKRTTVINDDLVTHNLDQLMIDTRLVEEWSLHKPIINTYMKPPAHEESVLVHENMSEDDYVLPSKDWDDEQYICMSEGPYREYLHRDCFHRVHSVDDLLPLISELPSDLSMHLVIIGGALTNGL